jgi:N-acetylmuramoyl-L-alanine amidase
MRQLLLLLLPLMGHFFASVGSAQTLSVNGREVAGLTLSLVEGVSYAPAGPFSEALGARSMIDYGSGLVSLELGARLLVLPTYTQVSALDGGTTWRVNGEARSGPGAVFHEGRLYLPVSAVVQALLGFTSYVPDRERVTVVLPRGELRDLDWQRQGRTDRLTIELSANVPYTLYYNEPLNSLEVRFDRTGADRLEPLEGGRRFRRASVLNERGSAQVRISLEEDTAYSVYSVPAGRGYRLVVDLFEDTTVEELPLAVPRVVIDAAHGGDDSGMGLNGADESGRTLELSRRLAEELERRGLRVELTRAADHAVPLSSRAGMGVGADMFLSIHTHSGTGDAVAVYYLSEADGAASLDMAIRQNAEAELARTTDALRRRLLLNLIPNVEVGRRYAQGLQGELFARGLRTADPQAAPLAVLTGAAGRGLLLELPAAAVTDDGMSRLVQALAEAVASLLGGREASR